MERIPGIVQIYNVVSANNTIYIIMEYVDGCTLDAYVEQTGGRLPYADAIELLTPAAKALCEMYSQVGAPIFDTDGLMKRGMIVRHLVLPACRHDSIKVLDTLSELFSPDSIKLSLMSQYTPDFALDTPYKNLHRKLTSFEYNSVLNHAISLGFDGYFQSLSSATSSYTPNFEE